MARQGLVGRRRPDRAGRGRGHDRAGDGGVDRAAGRLEDGARAGGRVRREDAPAARTSGSASARSSCSASPTCARPLSLAEPRSPRAARVLRLARVLQPRRDLPERAARLSGARSTCSRAACGSACGRRGTRSALRLADLGARGRGRVPARVPDRPQRRDAARRHRRRARRAWSAPSRILDGQAPYGNMPQRGDLEPCGPEDADGQVRERIQTNGRCEAAIERGDTYGPVSRTSPTSRPSPSSAGAGSGTRSRRRTRPRSRSTCWPCSASCSSACRFGGVAARRAARVRVGRLPVHGVHAEREHERRDHARVPRPRLLARHLALGARRSGRARRLGEVRRAARSRRSGRLSERSSCAASSRFAAAFVGGDALAFAILLLEPRSGEAVRRSGSGRSGSRSAATRRSRSGAGVSTTRGGSPISASSSRSSPSLAVALALVVGRRPAGQGTASSSRR